MLYNYFSLALLCKGSLLFHGMNTLPRLSENKRKWISKNFKDRRMCLVLISPPYSVGFGFRCWGEERSKTGICSDLEDGEAACISVVDRPWCLRDFLAGHPGCTPGFCLVWTPFPSFRGHRFSSHRTESTHWSCLLFIFITPELELLLLLGFALPFLFQSFQAAEQIYPNTDFIKTERVKGLKMFTLPLWLCL